MPVSLGLVVATDAVRAAQMAAEEINAAGGVNVGGVKRMIEIKEIDSRAMLPGVPAADSLLAYEKLILQNKVDAFSASAERSEVCLAAMDLIAKYKLIHIIPGAKSPTITQKVVDDYAKYKYNFRTTTNSVFAAANLEKQFQMIKDQFGFSSVFFISEDALWARGTVDLLKAGLGKAGWKAAGEAWTPLGLTDYSTALLQARNSGCQVLCIMYSNPEAGILIDQANTMQIPALIIGNASPIVGPGSWDLFKGRIEYACLTVAEIGNVPLKTWPKSVQFYDNYKKRWQREIEIDSVPAPSYDSVYVLAKAIEKAGGLDADKLVAAMEATDWEGAVGRIRFGKDHQAVYGNSPKETALSALIQWQKPGTRTVVWPAEAADGKIQLPPWIKTTATK
jgi:branched-chain amino acid transport system substrate-binding protein